MLEKATKPITERTRSIRRVPWGVARSHTVLLPIPEGIQVRTRLQLLPQLHPPVGHCGSRSICWLPIGQTKWYSPLSLSLLPLFPFLMVTALTFRQIIMPFIPLTTFLGLHNVRLPGQLYVTESHYNNIWRVFTRRWILLRARIFNANDIMESSTTAKGTGVSE